MSDRILIFLIATSALACGLNGGVFFAFSNFIMTALGRLTPAHGVEAMNSIGVTVINPLFMSILFGAADAEQKIECLPRIANHRKRLIRSGPTDRIHVRAVIVVCAGTGLIEVLDAKL